MDDFELLDAGSERKIEGRYRRIFHPTDLTPASTAAFAHALRIALAARAELSIYHASRDFDATHGSDFPSVRSALIQWGVLADGSERKAVARLGLRVKKIKGAGRDPVRAIARRLRTRPTDLVVLGMHRKTGLSGALRKAVAAPVARASGSMSLFVPEVGRGFVSPRDGLVSLKRVLLPVARDPHGQPAVDAAALLAYTLEAVDTNFILLHVGARRLRGLDRPSEADWRWHTVVQEGDVVRQVLEAADRYAVDLIALTTKGHEGVLDALRGSTTERILRDAPCPVLAVPARW